MDIYPEGYKCPACNKDFNVKGDHAVGCGSGGERNHCHDYIKAYFANLATSAGLSARREPTNTISGRKRPADVFISGLPIGAVGSAYNVTVVNPLQKAYIRANCSTSDIATIKARESKNKTYLQELKDENIRFFTLAFESLGGFDRQIVGQVKAITTLLAGRHT